MPSEKLITPLLSDKFYHIFNRVVARSRLCISHGDYWYFINKYQQYMVPVVDTYAYCIMPTHFHFLVKPKADMPDLEASKQLQRMFQSYVYRYNNEHNRKGNLFCKCFRRFEIKDEDYLKNVVRYIHMNPVADRLVQKMELYKFSSYPDFRWNINTFVDKDEVLTWFGGYKNFRKFHNDVTGNGGLYLTYSIE